ncbi:hypothetical protein M427DRAFT_67518 [Gonapodya prolifera JEL478]|uniref:Uncharacterized protein n=1 Tax=Gonapodya prolifera (strain JEL478) TaxID=1344416 RepID=A0A139AQB3_GONPJ|nr:hypothetical protein M427DRAFT_67518 [Gonapodya prolifera JEL478]|eukprot:KXS18926.1 hypothetical protein M427DRAFT_67518 [Gonapodya prolifera JEL478]
MDRYIADMILKESEEAERRFEEMGTRAYRTNGDRPVLKANTRFLSKVVRATDDHNRILLEQQRSTAEQKLRELGASGSDSDTRRERKKLQHDSKDGHGERRRHHEYIIERDGRSEWGSERRTGIFKDQAPGSERWVQVSDDKGSWSGASKSRSSRNDDSGSRDKDDDMGSHRRKRARKAETTDSDSDGKYQRNRGRDNRYSGSDTDTTQKPRTGKDNTRARENLSPKDRERESYSGEHRRKHRRSSERREEDQSPDLTNKRGAGIEKEPATAGSFSGGTIVDPLSTEKIENFARTRGHSVSSESFASPGDPEVSARRSATDSGPRNNSRDDSTTRERLVRGRGPVGVASRMDKYFEEGYLPQLDFDNYDDTNFDWYLRSLEDKEAELKLKLLEKKRAKEERKKRKERRRERKERKERRRKGKESDHSTDSDKSD